MKRSALIFLVLTAIVFFAREWLYNQVVTYRSIGSRTTYPATNPLLIEQLESADLKQADVRQIIDLALGITSQQLNFTAENNANDPNKLIYSRTAHCIGYAAYFATTCNYLLMKNGLDGQWVARPQIGQLYVLGINIHTYLDSPFLKDHDIVIIENKATGEILAVDPAINDYLGIDFISYSDK